MGLCIFKEIKGVYFVYGGVVGMFEGLNLDRLHGLQKIESK